MKIVKAGFKLYHQEYQQACRYTYRQPCNVNKRISFVMVNIPPCGFEKVLKHELLFLIFGYTLRLKINLRFLVEPFFE
jgi:hypothetical protein